MTPFINLPFPVIVPDWPDLPVNVHAFSTTRVGGCSSGCYGAKNGRDGLNLGDHVGDASQAVLANRQALNTLLPNDVTFLSQVHGKMVVDGAGLRRGVQADAVYASSAGVVCAVLTADCLPVLLADADGKVVAAAHAGWRGLAGGILQNTIEKMRQAGAGQIFAWMGPAIGAEQFEVGQDVLDAFAHQLENAANYFLPLKPNATPKYLANIYGLAGAILSDAGVQNVSGGQHCTVMEEDKFYSYRRDGVTGRMASLIWMS